jgi:hypothetical protein
LHFISVFIRILRRILAWWQTVFCGHCSWHFDGQAWSVQIEQRAWSIQNHNGRKEKVDDSLTHIQKLMCWESDADSLDCLKPQSWRLLVTSKLQDVTLALFYLKEMAKKVELEKFPQCPCQNCQLSVLYST